MGLMRGEGKRRSEERWGKVRRKCSRKGDKR